MILGDKTILFYNWIKNRYAFYRKYKSSPFLYFLRLKQPIMLSLKPSILFVSKKIYPDLEIYNKIFVLIKKAILNKVLETQKQIIPFIRYERFSLKPSNLQFSSKESHFYSKIKDKDVVSKREVETKWFSPLINIALISAKKAILNKVLETQKPQIYLRVSKLTSILAIKKVNNIIKNFHKIEKEKFLQKEQRWQSIALKDTYIDRHPLQDIRKEIKLEKEIKFIFSTQEIQFDKIKEIIQKEISKVQPKEEVISTLNKNIFSSKEIKNIAEQVYRLILRKWQKDLERRGIFNV